MCVTIIIECNDAVKPCLLRPQGRVLAHWSGARVHTKGAKQMSDQKSSDTKPTIVTLKLNRQQLELLDRTVAKGFAPDRVSLVRLALREYAATHAPRVVPGAKP
jgi:hypothetical protein